MDRMKKLLSAALGFCTAMSLAACAGGENLTFGTGGETGTYYSFGGTLAQYVSGHSETSVTAVTSNGSKANVEDLAAGDIQLGFVQSDVMSYAYEGKSLFESPVEGFSVAAALYMEQVQLVTLNPEIKTVSDLAGKNVSIGAAGSGVYFNALDVLGAYGLTLEDIQPVYQSFNDSTENLQDGKIDAAFIVAGAPTNALTSLAATSDLHLISLDDEHVDALIEASPYYTKAVIPASVYGTDEDVTTVAVAAVIIASDSVPEESIYQVVSSVFDNLEEIAPQHAKAKECSVEFAASIPNVPYHPGAARYFAEKGLEVPTK